MTSTCNLQVLIIHEVGMTAASLRSTDTRIVYRDDPTIENMRGTYLYRFEDTKYLRKMWR